MKSDIKRQAARKFREFWTLAKDSENVEYKESWHDKMPGGTDNEN